MHMILVARRLLCNDVIIVENDVKRMSSAIAVAFERRKGKVVLAAVQSGRVNVDENAVLKAFMCTILRFACTLLYAPPDSAL